MIISFQPSFCPDLPQVINNADWQNKTSMLIPDWKLYRESAPSDDHSVEQSLQRMEERFGEGAIRTLVADKGFDSAANEQLLYQKGMLNGLYSKDQIKMKVRSLSRWYQGFLTRLAQTEARIAILTNDFSGTPMRSKGFERRQRELG